MKLSKSFDRFDKTALYVSSVTLSRTSISLKKNEGTSSTNCGIKTFLREVLLLNIKKKSFFLKNSRALSITTHFTEYLAISVWQGLNDFSSIAGKVSTQSCFFFEKSKIFVKLVFEIQQKQSSLLSSLHFTSFDEVFEEHYSFEKKLKKCVRSPR